MRLVRRSNESALDEEKLEEWRRLNRIGQRLAEDSQKLVKKVMNGHSHEDVKREK